MDNSYSTKYKCRECGEKIIDIQNVFRSNVQYKPFGCWPWIHLHDRNRMGGYGSCKNNHKNYISVYIKCPAFGCCWSGG